MGCLWVKKKKKRIKRKKEEKANEGEERKERKGKEEWLNLNLKERDLLQLVHERFMSERHIEMVCEKHH